MKFDTKSMERDFTPTGMKLAGPYENDRNSCYAELYKAIIKEVYGVTDVICAHHLTFVRVEKRPDGFEYQIVEEIPSADALIFDHEVAKKLWGWNYQTNLIKLAMAPVEIRDALLAELFYGRADVRLQGGSESKMRSAD